LAPALLASELPDQMVMQLVHGDRDAAKIDARYAMSNMAALAAGSMQAGIEFGIELAQRGKKITGLPTSFAVSVTGDSGTVSWTALAETMQQLEAGNKALRADKEFAKMIDKEAGKMFQPGGLATITRKIV
jgi:hypothetical protein